MKCKFYLVALGLLFHIGLVAVNSSPLNFGAGQSLNAIIGLGASAVTGLGALAGTAILLGLLPALPFGKRDVDNYQQQLNSLFREFQNLVPENDISTPEGFMEGYLRLMEKTDPSECFPLLLCSIASNPSDYESLRPLEQVFNKTSPNMSIVPLRHQVLLSNMMQSAKIGQALDGMPSVCEKIFNCPFSAQQINKSAIDFAHDWMEARE